MSTPHHRPKKIATLAPHRDHANGFNWDISAVAFNDPFEVLQKKAAAKKQIRIKWSERYKKSYKA